MLAPSYVATGQAPPKEALPADARKPDGILRVGHTGLVQALAFSPDRRWLVSGGDDVNIIVWDLSTGREEFRLGGPKERNIQESFNKEAIISLAFSPDGTHLVSANNSGIIRMWNLQTRKVLFTIHPPRVHYYGVQSTFLAN
jgi:WD40 repeat protein